MFPKLVLACVVSCNGPSCKWISLGLPFRSPGMEAVKVRQAGEGSESGLARGTTAEKIGEVVEDIDRMEVLLEIPDQRCWRG